MRKPVIYLVVLSIFAAPGCRTESKIEDDTEDRTDDKTEKTVVKMATEKTLDSLLGGEIGVDHVGIGVRDLETSKQAYHETLGFGRPTHGKLPNGIKNINYYFEDTTYLETLSYWDREKAAWVARFTEKYSGAMFLVLCVSSANQTAAFLRKRGITTGKPVPGTILSPQRKNPPVMWRTFFLKNSPLPGDPVYFIEYHRQIRKGFLKQLNREDVRRRHFSHPNTAKGLRSAWMVVKDLEAAIRAYESIGLPAGRRFEDPRMGARGCEIRAGIGSILLLQANDPEGRTASFLEKRGEGIIGVSIEVGELKVARDLIEKNSNRKFPPYAGLSGQSILIPPELTYGVWLEMFQK